MQQCMMGFRGFKMVCMIFKYFMRVKSVEFDFVLVK